MCLSLIIKEKGMPINQLKQSNKIIFLMNVLGWEDRWDWSAEEKGNLEIIAVMQWLIDHLPYIPNDPLWEGCTPRQAIDNFYVKHNIITKTKVESRLREMGLCALKALYNAEKGRD